MQIFKRNLFRLNDIRFWILFFFLVRMYGITMPPLEIGHNWRQTDGMMIARNFYEHDANIFFPMVDVAGDRTGIVGCEFPILNYLVYLTSAVFGYEHWYGRLIVLISSCLGISFFHKLIARHFNEASAFNASIILLVSLWFSYSRKNIPDVFATSLCLVSLFFAFQFLEKGKLKDVLLFFILALLGCLSKILAATILTVLIFPILDLRYNLKNKILISIFSALILLGVCAWYFLWVPHLNETYGFGEHFFMGLSFKDGLLQITENWRRVLERIFFTPLKYIGFVAFFGSVLIAIKLKRLKVLAVFALPFLSYCILLVKTGASIMGDHYYILTAIPSMAFITGCGLAEIANKKIAIWILIAIGVECIADQIYDFRIRPDWKPLATLETEMDKISKRDDLIAVNSGVDNPTLMYFAHRRGWSQSNQDFQDASYVNTIKQKGCRYIVLAKELYGDADLGYRVVYDSKYFKIYSLK